MGLSTSRRRKQSRAFPYCSAPINVPRLFLWTREKKSRSLRIKFGNSDFFKRTLGLLSLPFVRSGFGKTWDLLLPFGFEVMFPEHWQLHIQMKQEKLSIHKLWGLFTFCCSCCFHYYFSFLGKEFLTPDAASGKPSMSLNECIDKSLGIIISELILGSCCCMGCSTEVNQQQ